MQKTLQIVGPFFTNYSYARVNRGLAFALDKIQDEYKVSLYCDKDKIDWWPSEKELESKPHIKKLFNPNKEFTDLVIYNNFPKSLNEAHGFKDLPGEVKMIYMAWEETIYPKQWVKEINDNIHGIMVASSFTRDVLINNGVKVPIEVILNSIDDDLRKEKSSNYPLATKKKVKFFHNSTGKVRKGVDILLKAYFEEFTANDNVTLVIKGFPNPDNRIEEQIQYFKKSYNNLAEIIYINTDLSDEEMRNLTAECSCGVFPSRSEGFGLPILECMFQNLPVITTNYSGQLDFCNEDNAYLIDYKLDFAKSSELVNIGAMWSEPSVSDLKVKMREVYTGLSMPNSIEEIKLKVKVNNAKKMANSISWENSAVKAYKFIKKIQKIAPLKKKNAGVISWFNNETGIADYSFDLYSSIENSFNRFYYISNKDIADRIKIDKNNVIRSWVSDELDFQETLNFIINQKLDIIHIQYHSGSMFSTQSLNILIKKLKKINIKIYITLHSVKGTSFDFIRDIENLNLANKVIILNNDDAIYASKTLNNIIINSIGNLMFKKRNKEDLKKKLGLEVYSPIIATHGLLNINKGILQIIESINQLKYDYPNILLIGLNAVSSNNIYSQTLLEEINLYIKTNKLSENILLINDFLDDDFIQILMQTSDINIFAYKDAGESASAAVRKGLNSLNPTIVTSIKQFEELNNEVLKISDNSPSSIVLAIKKILNDNSLSKSLVKFAESYIEKNSYQKKSIELLELYISD